MPHVAMRMLGIDYGRKRIGVAVSDETATVARPLVTISHTSVEKDCERIQKMVAELDVKRVVVGYPYSLSGMEPTQGAYIMRFAHTLASKLSVPVERWDESMSSRKAEEILIESDMGRARRKKVIDRLAAAIILQDYLDRNAGLKA